MGCNIKIKPEELGNLSIVQFSAGSGVFADKSQSPELVFDPLLKASSRIYMAHVLIYVSGV